MHTVCFDALATLARHIGLFRLVRMGWDIVGTARVGNFALAYATTGPHAHYAAVLSLLPCNLHVQACFHLIMQAVSVVPQALYTWLRCCCYVLATKL